MATSSISTCQSHWLRRGLEPSTVALSSLSCRACAGAVGTSWMLHHSLHHPLPHLRPLPHRPRGCHPLRFLRGSLPRFSRQQNPNPNVR